MNLFFLKCILNKLNVYLNNNNNYKSNNNQKITLMIRQPIHRYLN